MNKKAAIFKTAIRLFAAQGYEATTTLQIAREVGVTEPTVFYHFKNKSALFSTIIETASAIYMEQLNRLHPSGLTAFDAIEALIRMHFSIVSHEPECMCILIRTCPARFEDQENACIRSYRRSRTKLKRTVSEIIERGMVQNEFRPVRRRRNGQHVHCAAQLAWCSGRLPNRINWTAWKRQPSSSAE